MDEREGQRVAVGGLAEEACRRWRRPESLGERGFTRTRIPRADAGYARLPSDALNTRTALTLYLLIVSVITARTVALTLIKVQLNKTKTENNHFCLTGKMARYVAEAVTTHAPLVKHMFFRPELCAGLMHRGCRCCAARPPGEAPPELETDKRVRTGCE